MRLVILVAATAILADMLTAQAASPPRRAHHSLAYDEAAGRVILTGGSTPTDGGNRFTLFNDIWTFDGARWTLLGESGQKMSGTSLAWDSRRNRLLSFGGYMGPSLGVVRMFEGSEWRDVGQHPEIVVAEPGFTFDTRRARFVAFGGSAGRGQTLGDTWEFDGSAWTKLTTAGPPARQGHAMVYDEKRGRTIVFGGTGRAAPGTPPPALSDLWEFDGTAWTERQTNGPTPGARFASGVAYDSKRGLVILFGGLTSDGFKGDTWSWDGTEWKQLATTGPEPRAMGYLAYDKRRDRVVLFGGRKGWPDGDLNDTWEWDGTAWKQLGTSDLGFRS
jgi:hypothetical protein